MNDVSLIGNFTLLMVSTVCKITQMLEVLVVSAYLNNYIYFCFLAITYNLKLLLSNYFILMSVYCLCNVIIILPLQVAGCKTTESFLYDPYFEGSKSVPVPSLHVEDLF